MMPKRATCAPIRGEHKPALSQIASDQKAAVNAIVSGGISIGCAQYTVSTVAKVTSSTQRSELNIRVRRLRRGKVIPHHAQTNEPYHVLRPQRGQGLDIR